MRVSREMMFMEMARAAAKRSTCLRLNVGAIVTRGNVPISIGYNGQSPGAPHCLSPCREGECNTVHAERNALDRMPSCSLLSCDLYTTTSPCFDCARLIVSRGTIKHVYYEYPYRSLTAGIQCLLDNSIPVSQLLPSGALIPHAR